MNRSRTALAVLAASILAAASLTACSSTSTPKPATAPAPAAEEPSAAPADDADVEPEPEETAQDLTGLGFDDTADFDGVTIALSSFRRGVSSEYAAPENTPYARFTVTVHNGRKAAVDLNDLTVTCSYGDSGREGEEIFDTDQGLDGIPMNHVLPGRTGTGVVACELPQGESYLQVEVMPGLADPAIFSGTVK